MLGRFENDWVSKEFLKQNIRDRRKYSRVMEDIEAAEDGGERFGGEDDDA